MRGMQGSRVWVAKREERDPERDRWGRTGAGSKRPRLRPKTEPAPRGGWGLAMGEGQDTKEVRDKGCPALTPSCIPGPCSLPPSSFPSHHPHPH